MNKNPRDSGQVKETRQVYTRWIRSLHPNARSMKSAEQSNSRRDSSNYETTNTDAVFIGWQDTPSGSMFALYNVTAAKHPLFHSTVTAKTLYEQNLKIPPTPAYKNKG
jgi:hypothetical protein